MQGPEIEFDNELRQLSFYSVESGDTIQVKWWQHGLNGLGAAVVGLGWFEITISTSRCVDKNNHKKHTLIRETVCRLCPEMCSVCDGSVNSTVCAYWAKCKISVVTVQKGRCDRSEESSVQQNLLWLPTLCIPRNRSPPSTTTPAHHPTPLKEGTFMAGLAFLTPL